MGILVLNFFSIFLLLRTPELPPIHRQRGSSACTSKVTLQPLARSTWRSHLCRGRLTTHQCCFLSQIRSQANAGLANLQNDDDLIISYDSLVKAKGLLDLIFELPSFEMELGELLEA